MAWLRLVAWLQAGQGLFSDDAKGFFLFPKGIMVLDVARWWEGNSCWGWELCPPALYPWYMQEVQLVLVGHEPVLDGTWWVLGYNLRSPVFIFAFLAKLQPQMGWSRLNRLLCKLAGRRMFVACYRVLPSCPWWWHLKSFYAFQEGVCWKTSSSGTSGFLHPALSTAKELWCPHLHLPGNSPAVWSWARKVSQNCSRGGCS